MNWIWNPRTRQPKREPRPLPEVLSSEELFIWLLQRELDLQADDIYLSFRVARERALEDLSRALTHELDALETPRDSEYVSAEMKQERERREKRATRIRDILDNGIDLYSWMTPIRARPRKSRIAIPVHDRHGYEQGRAHETLIERLDSLNLDQGEYHASWVKRYIWFHDAIPLVAPVEPPRYRLSDETLRELGLEDEEDERDGRPAGVPLRRLEPLDDDLDEPFEPMTRVWDYRDGSKRELGGQKPEGLKNTTSGDLVWVDKRGRTILRPAAGKG